MTDSKKPAVSNDKPTYCRTPKFRAAFANVFEKRGFPGQEPKYSIVMLFDKKTADIEPLIAAANAAAADKWGQDKSKWPKNLKMPFRDGDEKPDLGGYPGSIYITATAKNPPTVLNLDTSLITKESRSFYSGCFARASVNAFTFDVSGNKGVSFGLSNVQKMGDGPEFSGRKKAEDEFDKVEDSSEDASSYDNEDMFK